MGDDGSGAAAVEATVVSGGTSIEELRRRRRNQMILGTVILLGAVMPTKYYWGFSFSDLPVVNEGSPGGYSWSFTQLYHEIRDVAPGLFGAAVLAAACLARPRVRGGVILATGLLPGAWLLFSVAMRPPETVARLDVQEQLLFLVMAIAGLGWMGTFIGLRVRCYDPDNLTGFQVGRVGGGLCLLSMVLPVFPAEAGFMALLLPIMGAFFIPSITWEQATTLVLILAVLLLTAAAAWFALLTGINRSREEIRRRARTGFRLLLAAPILTAGATLFFKLADELKLSVALSSLAAIALAAMDLLIPVGVTDLLLGGQRLPLLANIKTRWRSELKGSLVLMLLFGLIVAAYSAAFSDAPPDFMLTAFAAGVLYAVPLAAAALALVLFDLSWLWIAGAQAATLVLMLPALAICGPLAFYAFALCFVSTRRFVRIAERAALRRATGADTIGPVGTRPPQSS